MEVAMRSGSTDQRMVLTLCAIREEWSLQEERDPSVDLLSTDRWGDVADRLEPDRAVFGHPQGPRSRLIFLTRGRRRLRRRGHGLLPPPRSVAAVATLPGHLQQWLTAAAVAPPALAGEQPAGRRERGG